MLTQPNFQFSLLVPCFNASSYISGFIEQLKKQKKPFDEVIFYDDGSSDDTYTKLSELGLKVIKGEENRGPSFARNRLINASSSDWVHFHDIDDEMHPDYLLRTSQVALKGNIDVVICNADWVNPESRKSIIQWKYSDAGIKSDPVCYTIEHPIGGINGLYKKDLLEQINGFDESLPIWEDSDLHVRLAHVGARFEVIEEFLVISNRFENTQSKDEAKIQFFRFQVLSKYASILKGKCQNSLKKELSKTYRNAVLSKDRSLEKSLLDICKKINFSPPYSDNQLIRALKLFLQPRHIILLKDKVLKTQQFLNKIHTFGKY